MKQRIITGVIAGALFIGMIIFGGIPFSLMVALLAVIAMMELLRMKNINYYSLMGILSLLLVVVIVVPNDWLQIDVLSTLTRIDLLLIFIVIFLALTVFTKNSVTFDDVGFVILASFYAGFGFHFLIETRLLEQGLTLVIFILLLIWSTDTGAYFAGRSFGKRKLWPEISPKKTIEGAIGGLLSALVVGLLYNIFIPIFDSSLKVIIMIIVISLIGQLGDLVESALKRHYSVKDSGTILPGHGGILDRFDSLIFVMPVLYLFQFI